LSQPGKTTPANISKPNNLGRNSVNIIVVLGDF
jgi:hypothetical protein